MVSYFAHISAPKVFLVEYVQYNIYENGFYSSSKNFTYDFMSLCIWK